MRQRFRKVTAPTLEQAYREVRGQYGPDAVVISTQSVSAPGLRGFFGQKHVEVTASVPIAEQPPRRASAAEQRYAQQSTLRKEPEMKQDRVEYFERLVRDAQSRMNRPAAAAGGGRAAAATQPAAMPQENPSVLPFPKPAKEGPEEFKRELKEIREMLQVLYAEHPGAGLPAEYAPHYRMLTEQGVSRKTAAALLGAVTKDGDLSVLRDARVFLERLHFEIRKLAPVTGGTALQSGQRRVVALCGATGVGKTTNLAKLAAHFAVHERAKVALLTTDTYRIAAPEQLRVYANIIGVPFRVANDAKEAVKAVQELADHDLILVDTAGGSQFNLEQIKELKTTLAALQPDETMLVLSANIQAENLGNIINNFKCINPTSLMFTKLDETRHYGALLSLLLETQLPASYLSVGQTVPDDLRAATPEIIANLILKGTKRHA